MKHITLIIYLLFTTIFISHAQTDKPATWGEVSLEELSDGYLQDKYPEAEAVILSSYGEYTVNHITTALKKQIRIKVLSKEGLDYGNVQIDFLRLGRNQKCIAVEAASYNLVEGKIVKAELKPTNLFLESTKTESSLSFAIPKVKVGSIIEYTYTIESINNVIPPIWYFQSTIPTLRSEFRIKKFATPYAGYSIMLEGAQLNKKYSAPNKKIKNWVLHDIPALPEVPYLPNLKDYFNKLYFLFVWNTPKTWNSIAKQFKNDTRFGVPLAQSGGLKKVIAQVTNEHDTPEQKMRSIFKYCQTQYKWNGYYSKYFKHQELKENLQAKSLPSGSINLILINMLQQADLEAWPTLISTRAHGKVFKDIIQDIQFNHTIAIVIIDGNTYFLDASQDYNSINTLPIEDLNDVGLVLKKGKAEWIAIKPKIKNKQTVSYHIDLSNLETPAYKVIYKYQGNLSDLARAHLLEEDHKEFLQTEWSTLDFSLDSGMVSNKYDNEKPIGATFYLSMPDQLDADADRIYVNPFITREYEDNPFIQTQRKLPIRFPFTYKKQYITSMTLPQNYEVEELPKSHRVELPEKMGSLTYQAKQLGNRLQFIVLIQLNQTEIHPKHYASLKIFYEKVIEKMNTTVVLRKIGD